MSQSLHIKGAHIWDREDVHDIPQYDLFIEKGRIVAERPRNAVTVDLQGLTIFPGLINAHDHLHMNHFPRTKFREVYNNAHEWGEDVDARLETEPYKSLRAVPIKDRLFIGGLKNLLCGATTVAHHDQPFREMHHKDFPVRVLKKYGWAHSLHFNTDEEVVRSYRNTPEDWPWFIHLAEGTDDVAAGEYQKLKALGCVGLNTIPVHCVGLTREDVFDSVFIPGEQLAGHGSQLPTIWCPTSNMYLLGKTEHPRMMWNTQQLLGSDSRLTADGDLLDEMRFVTDPTRPYPSPKGHFAVCLATQMTFRSSWDLKDRVVGLCEEDRGDCVVIYGQEDAANKLCHSRRADLALVVRDGIPRIGDPEIMGRFPHVETVPATLDGKPKRIHIKLARQIHQCSLDEPGLEVDDLPTGKRFWFL